MEPEGGSLRVISDCVRPNIRYTYSIRVYMYTHADDVCARVCARARVRACVHACMRVYAHASVYSKTKTSNPKCNPDRDTDACLCVDVSVCHTPTHTLSVPLCTVIPSAIQSATLMAPWALRYIHTREHIL